MSSGVSLKDRKRSVDLYSLLGVQCGGSGEAWQIGHVELKSGDDWVSGCWPVEMWK